MKSPDFTGLGTKLTHQVNVTFKSRSYLRDMLSIYSESHTCIYVLKKHLNEKHNEYTTLHQHNLYVDNIINLQ